MNMSQEEDQKSHQSWGCPETLDQFAAGDHAQKTGRSESQQRKHPQQRQQAGKEHRHIAKGGFRLQSMTRIRGQDGVRSRGPPEGSDRRRLRGSREIPEEEGDQLQGERRGQPHPSSCTRSTTWRTPSHLHGRYGGGTWKKSSAFP